MENREIIDKALALPLSERVELAQALWQSIDAQLGRDAIVDEREVIERAKKRDLELQTGAVAGRSHQPVMEKARRALQCD